MAHAMLVLLLLLILPLFIPLQRGTGKNPEHIHEGKREATSMKQLRSSGDKTERATRAVRAILASYPLGANTTRDFVQLMVRTLATYPVAVIDRVEDMRSGITTKFPEYVPSHGQLVEFCDQIADKLHQKPRDPELKALSMDGYHAARTGRPEKYNPFPKLTEAFASEPHLLQKPFDTLFAGSKALATSGPYEARAILERGRDFMAAKDAWCFPHKLPPFDISDFPAADDGKDQK